MRACLLLFLAALICTEEPWVIGSDGVTYHATTAEVLTRPVVFAGTGASGLEASFIARSLRDTTIDDMRVGQRVSGTRRDMLIDQPRSSCGSDDERRRFGIAGNAGDWDNFSVQWDGTLLVPAGGMDLATTSDDGTRVWLDKNHDGLVQAGEWGSNGWGRGQGATLGQVHSAVPAGSVTIRVQFEDGGGPNCCSLLWRPAGGNAAWAVVPTEAFARTPVLTISGPVTFASPLSGNGELHLGEGVILATAPQVGLLAISGRVTLAADLPPNDLDLIIPRGATLDLAGHHLRCDSLRGEGTVQLAGGSLTVAKAEKLAVRGTGHLETSGALVLAGLDASVSVTLHGDGSVRSPERCLLRRALAAPLSTVLELGAVPENSGLLVVELDGPLAGAGLMAWRADRHGRWFQRLAAAKLDNGRQRIEVDLSATGQLQPIGHDATWNALTAAESGRAGLLIYADHALSGSVLADVRWLPPRSRRQQPMLQVLSLPPSRTRTGERLELTVRPLPFPRLPLDPDCFSVELEVSAPDGSTTRYAGFADQPFTRVDRGDRERLLADGPPRFGLRFRARQAGEHRLRLLARWADGGSASAVLPSIVAEGLAWDDITRVDAGDPRFLSSQGRFVWPIGQNLNSTYDVRSASALGTKLTPDRGSFTREAFLARLIAAGGTGGETWLSPWNLGLEWTDAWVGFHGAGNPNLGNAWALDRYLDLAERHGVRMVISIFNHGQGRNGSSAEDDWGFHPWRTENGGWLDSPSGLFNDARALKAQSDLFRYLAARWGDSPAVLTWKLWAEVNLVSVPVPLVRAWHRQATALFNTHDPWRHPVTTHWCGDWSVPDREIAAQPGLNMLTIDAYHGDETSIADLLGQSTRDARRSNLGLAYLGKPILVTEFGGSPGATAAQRLKAELDVGGWAAFVHGHAGSPLLWWFEWIDQGKHYGSFGALRRFIEGEDLRNPAAGTIAPSVGGNRMWCRVWKRPGRMLGYVLDSAWVMSGGRGTTIGDGVLDFGEVNAGPMQLQWWDADLGAVNREEIIDHPGGRLRLVVPGFSRHLAFKLWRP